MYIFYSLYQLYSNHKDRLQTKLASAVLKQVFKTRSKQVHNHHVVVPLNAIVVDLRYVGIVEQFVQLCLGIQLRKFSFYWFKFNSYFFVSLNIES